MIYKLPSKGRTNYSGKYPNRLRSLSMSKGIIHVELNTGERFVSRYSDVSEDFRVNYRGRDHVGLKTLEDVYGACVPVYDMALADYAAIILMDRLVRSVRLGINCVA